MHNTNILNKLIYFWLMLSFLVSCQFIPSKLAIPLTDLTFDAAIRQLSRTIMTQLQQRHFPFTRSIHIVFDPFIAVESGQVVQASLEIEALFLEEIQKHFNHFQISRLTPQTLTTANYIISGFIKSEINSNNLNNKKYYQVTATIVDSTHDTVVANGKVNMVSESGLDYQPTPSYQDNPMYSKNQRLADIINIVESPVGTQVNSNYYPMMATKALLVEAQTAYDQGNYELARRLFQNLIQQPNGKIMEAYGGLYSATLKLGNLKEAEQIFAQMVAIGIEEGNLPVKLLFQPHLTEFLVEPALRQQYSIWLRQISWYFKEHPHQCVNIIGHTSKYGIYEYNKRLSKRRAEKIQHLMQHIVPDIIHRSKTIGKGPDETIVGTIPDGAENAIDRRVEFKIVSC